MRLITLTTDFGYQDGFAGVLKGVILSRAPDARLVDLAHGVPRGDVRAAAFVLSSAQPYFPADSVHVAVVDPGVGSDRAPLAIRCDRGFLVGPDNGVFGLVLARARSWSARRIELAVARRREVSATFHGRDIFAPAAAWLAKGGRFDRIGPRVTELVELPWPTPRREPNGWTGEVIYVDTFGNATTNLPNHCVADAAPGAWEARLPRGRRCPLGACYAAVKAGRSVMVPGSEGCWEIAVHGGHAASQLDLAVGSPVRLRRVARPPSGSR